MTKAYYSTVFEQPAGEVWEIIRDFNNYPVWVGGAGESRIEDGKTGDTVGAVRNVRYQGRQIRQRLLAHSDVERSQTYEFCGAASLPVTGFQATLRITPIVDGDRAFVEWWATFDCEAPRRDELAGTLWAGSANGSNRCERRWRTAKAQWKAPLRPQQTEIRVHFRKISG
jgi:Polyketide cyclase / dehydrase and lipid transport